VDQNRESSVMSKKARWKWILVLAVVSLSISGWLHLHFIYPNYLECLQCKELMYINGSPVNHSEYRMGAIPNGYYSLTTFGYCRNNHSRIFESRDGWIDKLAGYFPW